MTKPLPNQAFKAYCPTCKNVHTTITCPILNNNLTDHPHSELVKEFGYCTYCATKEAEG